MTSRHTLFFILFFTIKCYSQEKWSLLQCVDYAMKNNVSIKQSDVQARLTRLSVTQSQASLYPNLSGGINSSYQHGLTEDPTTGTLVSSSFISGSGNLQASYNIFNWNARKNSIAANRLYLKADEVGIDKARNDISLAVANAFLQVMLRREQARISEVQVNQSRSQLEITRKLVNAGSQPELNAIQIEAQLAKDSSGLLQAQALSQQALINLKAYMNYDFALPFDIASPAVESIPVENIADLQPAAVYQLALNTQPLQKMYRLRIEGAQKEAKAARGFMYPSLSAFGGINTRAVNAKYPVTAFAPPDSTNAFVTIGSTQYKVFAPSVRMVGTEGIPFFRQLTKNFGQSIGLGISFSIFNSYNSRTQWERAKVNVNQLQLQDEQENLNLKTNIYNAYQDSYSSLQKYNASRRTVEYSQKAFDFAKKRYDIGLLGTLDFIITQNNLYLAQIDEISNHYDFVFKMKVLEFYKGQGIKL
ncbi:MAG: TolC family protein [Segetibacter sp.]|jgi:outer membrane protein|nr:TolC family protein [Segetibacter sp.]